MDCFSEYRFIVSVSNSPLTIKDSWDISLLVPCPLKSPVPLTVLHIAPTMRERERDREGEGFIESRNRVIPLNK